MRHPMHVVWQLNVVTTAPTKANRDYDGSSWYRHPNAYQNRNNNLSAVLFCFRSGMVEMGRRHVLILGPYFLSFPQPILDRSTPAPACFPTHLSTTPVSRVIIFQS
jgi:hypothetical protein